MSDDQTRPPEHDEPMPEGEEAPPPGVHAMAIVRWILVGLMALAAAGAILYYVGAFERDGASQSSVQYYCPMHPSVVQDHPGECPICSMTLVQREGGGAMQRSEQMSAHEHGTDAAAAPYYCPMHPEETSTDPNARCPKCGMKMEPNPAAQVPGPPAEGKAGAPAGSSVPALAPVELTPERIQLTGMKTASVARETLAPELRTVGYVTANEEGLAQIQTRFAGWVEELFVAQTGQRVEKGQVLATIYSPELLGAQQELLNARRWARESTDPSEADQALSGLARDSRHRLELLGISNEEIDELIKTGKPKRALSIRSPVAGFVIAKNVVQGASVEPGTELFRVADLSTVWVVADVYEHEIQRVQHGQRARLSLAAFPGQRFTGQVTFIYPTLDPDTRTLRVRMTFPNMAHRMLPGMYGDVILETRAERALVVPVEAVVDTGEVQYVFVALGNGRFEPRQVRLGVRTRDRVQVIEGLAEGETVVTTGNFLLDSESRLRAAIEGQLSGGGGVAPAGPASGCERDFDKTAQPEKYRQCRACEIQHRGMGSMEEDCKSAIPKPWR